MNQTIRRAVLLAAALAAPAAAQPSSEMLAVSAGARFDAAAFGLTPGQFRPLGSALPPLGAAGTLQWENDMKAASTLPKPISFQSAAPTAAADLDLAALLNRHLKTNLRYQLSGRTVWFSGAFDNSQKPYVSVLVDGYAPRYFDVKALLNQEQSVSVGGASYTLSLSPNIFHRMKSTINLKNDANSREAARFSVQDMLDNVAAAGQRVALSDQSYQFYYADGLNGGVANPNARMFVFIFGNGADSHVYLIPESLVPSDKIGVFKMFNDKRVGLVNSGGRLKVIENP